MKLLYVLERWPELSQTFVAEEIKALELAGHSVEVACLNRGDGLPTATPIVCPADTGAAARSAAIIQQIAHAPRATFAQIASERAWPPPDANARLRGLFRLATFRRAAVRSDHIHAHVATEAADMARLLAAASHRTWSFTAHGADAYADPAQLRVNLGSAKFARAASPHVAEQLRSASPTAKIVEVPVAVALDRFNRTSSYSASGPLVSTGRLVEKKGFEDLINAFGTAQLGDRELWIIGDGPLRKDLEGRAEGLNVRFLGAQTPDEVAVALSRASAFALLSKMAEDGDRDGRPAAIVEAMAAGLPVVSTSVPGISDLVQPDFGLLVSPASAVEAAVAIRELMDLDPTQRQQMGLVAKSRSRPYDPSVVASEMTALFESAVS